MILKNRIVRIGMTAKLADLERSSGGQKQVIEIKCGSSNKHKTTLASAADWKM